MKVTHDEIEASADKISMTTKAGILKPGHSMVLFDCRDNMIGHILCTNLSQVNDVVFVR